jgi:hypothetical protein
MEKTGEKQPTSEKGKLKHTRRKMSPFGHVFRFFGWWFGFTGLYSMFAVCPFCGQQACPVGLASAGTFGAFFALCFQNWKRLFIYLKHKLPRETEGETSSNNAMHPHENSVALHSRR